MLLLDSVNLQLQLMTRQPPLQKTAARCLFPCSNMHHPAARPGPMPSPAPQGDNNWGDDRSLYPKGQLWLNRGHIMGKVVG